MNVGYLARLGADDSHRLACTISLEDQKTRRPEDQDKERKERNIHNPSPLTIELELVRETIPLADRTKLVCLTG